MPVLDPQRISTGWPAVKPLALAVTELPADPVAGVRVNEACGMQAHAQQTADKDTATTPMEIAMRRRKVIASQLLPVS